MTVIKGKKNYNYPKPSSSAGSDTESLHLGSVSASDTESVDGEHSGNRLHVYRPLPVKISHIEDLVHIKKGSGKKKMRRYQNKCVLHTLNEEDENENIIVVMEDYKSPFARLLEDPNALEYWNDFIEKSEEEQNEIVRNFSERLCDYTAPSTEKTDKGGKLSSRIRRTIKIRKNLSLETVKELEDELIDFFKATPQGTYIRFPPTSFDRLLIHALAQYHKLKSLSILEENEGKRSVEVYNMHNEWTPANCFLTDFVKELRR